MDAAKPKVQAKSLPKKAISPQALAGKAFGLFQPERKSTPVVKDRHCAGMVLSPQGWRRESFGCGDESVSGDEITQRHLGGLGDADARSHSNAGRVEGVVADPEAGLWRGEVEIVIAQARDAEGLAEATGTGGQFGP